MKRKDYLKIITKEELNKYYRYKRLMKINFVILFWIYIILTVPTSILFISIIGFHFGFAFYIIGGALLLISPFILKALDKLALYKDKIKAVLMADLYRNIINKCQLYYLQLVFKNNYDYFNKIMYLREDISKDIDFYFNPNNYYDFVFNESIITIIIDKYCKELFHCNIDDINGIYDELLKSNNDNDLMNYYNNECSINDIDINDLVDINIKESLAINYNFEIINNLIIKNKFIDYCNKYEKYDEMCKNALIVNYDINKTIDSIIDSILNNKENGINIIINKINDIEKYKKEYDRRYNNEILSAKISK